MSPQSHLGPVAKTYKTLPVTQTTIDRLNEHRLAGEGWDAFFARQLDLGNISRDRPPKKK